VLVWLSVWTEVQIVCIWSSWCHCISVISFTSRLVLPFWYLLTQVVLEKRPLNRCSCGSGSSSSSTVFLKKICISPSQKQRMDASWIGIFYEQVGVWCSFHIPWLDPSPRSPIFGKMGKLPQISPKNWRCPHSPYCRNQTARRLKTVKYSFESGIIDLHFDQRDTSLPLPILEEAWRTRCTSFI